MDNITTYVINLKRSKDRRNLMKKMYKNSKIKIIEAYDGNILYGYKDINLPKTNIYSTLGKKKNEILSKYEVAVSLSHLKAIKIAYENNDDYAIIMEDDICNTYKKKWEKSLSEIIENRPKDTECLLLFCINPRLSITLILSHKEYIPLNYDMHWSAGCYFITRNGLEKIYKMYIKNGIIDFTFVDDIYISNNFIKQILVADRKLIYPHLNTYHYTRPTFTDACVKSTIHEEHKLVHAINDDILIGYFRRLNINNKNQYIIKKEDYVKKITYMLNIIIILIINMINILLIFLKYTGVELYI